MSPGTDDRRNQLGIHNQLILTNKETYVFWIALFSNKRLIEDCLRTSILLLLLESEWICSNSNPNLPDDE
jgi:hypothetical protein